MRQWLKKPSPRHWRAPLSLRDDQREGTHSAPAARGPGGEGY